jgi:DNA-binding LytR/AlgR family response regulator
MNKDALKWVLIVEDDKRQSDNLSKMVQSVAKGINVLTAVNHREAIEIARRERIDLFFLDIDLEDHENGYELAEHLRKEQKYELTWMVFLTINPNYELKAYKKVHCYEYVLKPYKKVYIQTLVNRLLFPPNTKVEQSAQAFIMVEIEHLQVKIFINEIIFVEARGRNVEIVTVRGTYTANYTPLKKIANLLAHDTVFIKTHRSFIVNVNYIESIRKVTNKQYEVHFINGGRFALLSVKHKETIERRLLENNG